jgi:hypothetical protein
MRKLFEPVVGDAGGVMERALSKYLRMPVLGHWEALTNFGAQKLRFEGRFCSCELLPGGAV